MNYVYKDFSWVLYSERGNEIARFKSKSELLKFIAENPDAGTQKTVSKEEEVFDEEEILDEEEEDS